MHATGKIFGKICLETLSDTFQYVVCDQGMEGGIQFFGMEGGGGRGGDIQQKWEIRTFWSAVGWSPHPKSFP